MSENIEVLNPYNENHVKLFTTYDQKTQITNGISKELENIHNQYTEEEFKQIDRKSLEITRTIFLEKDGKISSYCNLQGEKDRKLCQLILGPVENLKEAEQLLKNAENYAFDTLGMEELIFLDSKASPLPSKYFLNHNYESLGEESGQEVYMKSRVLEPKNSYQI